MLASYYYSETTSKATFPLLFRRKTSVGASSCPKYWRLTLNCGTLLTGIAHTSFFCAVFHRTYFCDPGSERGHYQFNGPINRAWRIQSLALKTIRLVCLIIGPNHLVFFCLTQSRKLLAWNLGTTLDVKPLRPPIKSFRLTATAVMPKCVGTENLKKDLPFC